MSDVHDILAHAWNKDAVNLAPALDNVLSTKVADAIRNMTADVAASMFGATVGNDMPETQEDLTDQEDIEGTTDDNF